MKKKAKSEIADEPVIMEPVQAPVSTIPTRTVNVPPGMVVIKITEPGKEPRYIYNTEKGVEAIKKNIEAKPGWTAEIDLKKKKW